MADHFADKRYIVTGAASGIGLATARLLVQRGARVVLWDRDETGLERAAADLRSESMCIDITQEDQIRAAMQHTITILGGLDGVVHSAGILHTSLFHKIPVERHRAIVDTNLTGTLLVAHAALPHVRAARGSLVLLASVAAFHGPPEYASYAASKAGILAFAQALRVELSGQGVHIGVVTPNIVDTPLLTSENRRGARMMNSQSPLLIVNQPHEIAAAIVSGIERRRFLIYTGWRSRLVYWLSRYAAWTGHIIMTQTWRQAGGRFD